MGGKKKGKKGRKGGRKEEDKEATDCHFEQQEEVTALSAIFQDDFRLISSEPFVEFSILLVPHTGQDDTLQEPLSVELQVRYVATYPNRPPKLRVLPKGGLDEAEVHHLQDMLAEQAASIAREGRVMVFNLCEATREFLFTHARGPSLSLWDQMQERSIDTSATEQTWDAVAGTGGVGQQDLSDAALVTDWLTEGDTWPQEEGYEKRPQSSGGGRHVHGRESNPGRIRADELKAGGVLAKPRPIEPQVKGTGQVAGGAAGAVDVRKVGGREKRKGKRGNANVGSGAEDAFSSGDDEVSPLVLTGGARQGRSSVTELLQGVRNGLLRVGTAVTRPLLEWSRGGTPQAPLEDGSESDTAESGEEDEGEEETRPVVRKGTNARLASESGAPLVDEKTTEKRGGDRRKQSGLGSGLGGTGLGLGSEAAATQAIRKDLLLGHMLRLLCSPRGPVPHALPALTGQLARIGMLPSWARELVAHQPALFEKAFRSMFGKVAQEAEARSEPATRWAVAKFWGGGAEAREGEEREGAESSRYLADFQEVSLLGRGGFGSVMLCINKLDGRRYAIKKIRLRSSSALENSRILREVATLSRLQHQNVVRYYQAWFESGRGSLVGVVDGSTDTAGASGGDWLTEGTPTITRRASTESGKSEDGGEGHVQHLYIQMEYCPRTLRQVLDGWGSGAVDADVAWRMVRQIVEGLAHIHANHTIHRDLTPNNIFADPTQVIKIGDFGLAKFTDLDPAEGTLPEEDENEGDDVASGRPAARGPPESVEGTGQIGTYLYTAPEIEQGWPKIDDKCDMYSLGIVVLELFHPFSTAMERAVLLNDLKQKGALPAAWADSHPAQAALVRWLVAPNPADRPSAVEVLHSSLLPPRMEDEALNDVLRMLHTGGDTAVTTRILGAVFDDERLAAQAEELQGGSLERPLVQPSQSAPEWALRAMREVFQRHGAQPSDTPALEVIDDPTRCPRQAVRLADAGGNVLALRYETRTPLAIQLAHAQTTSLRRYEIARVFRRAVGRSAPRALLQAEFDIVGGSARPESRTLAEAEAIKVALEVVGELVPSVAAGGHSEGSSAGGPPGAGGASGLLCEVRLSHRELLSAVWSWAGVPLAARPAVAQLLGMMAAWPPRTPARKAQWPLIRRQLLQGLRLPEAAVDRLQAVERRLSGPAEEALPRLRGALPPTRATTSALDEVGSLLAHLRVWGIEEQVGLDALMVPHDEYVSGVFFQVHLATAEVGTGEGSARGGMRTGGNGPPAACVAVGGRYDALLRRFWPESAPVSAPGAVGLSMGVAKLVAAASAAGSSPLSVLVCSRGGGGLLRERMQVAAELWAGGVRAQFLASVAPSLTEQYEYAHEQGIKWLVLITEEKLSAAGAVKVRNLDARSEEEVARADLVKHFLEPHLSRKRTFQSKHGS